MRNAEWKTWVLSAVIYAGWGAVTYCRNVLPNPMLVALGGWFVAWHGSLQHETIHGHPTRSTRINALIGGWPLALWLPYGVYRRTHVNHHRSPHPTHPDHDPESRYVLSDHGWRFRVARWEATLAGRLTLGPVLQVIRFAIEEVCRARTRPAACARDWGWHAAGLIAIIAWLRFASFPVVHYALLCVLPGIALGLLRSFAEHRADSLGPSRAATVRSRGPLALLFLNNNLHAAHHAQPELPWYALPAAERTRHARPEPSYAGYRTVLRRHLFAPNDRIQHPGEERAI